MNTLTEQQHADIAYRRSLSEHERRIYDRGARDEVAWRSAGMSDDARQVYECVQVLGSHRDADAPEIVEWIAVVFSTDWAWRAKIALAWRLTGGSAIQKARWWLQARRRARHEGRTAK